MPLDTVQMGWLSRYAIGIETTAGTEAASFTALHVASDTLARQPQMRRAPGMTGSRGTANIRQYNGPLLPGGGLVLDGITAPELDLLLQIVTGTATSPYTMTTSPKYMSVRKYVAGYLYKFLGYRVGRLTLESGQDSDSLRCTIEGAAINCPTPATSAIGTEAFATARVPLCHHFLTLTIGGVAFAPAGIKLVIDNQLKEDVVRNTTARLDVPVKKYAISGEIRLDPGANYYAQVVPSILNSTTAAVVVGWADGPSTPTNFQVTATLATVKFKVPMDPEVSSEDDILVATQFDALDSTEASGDALSIVTDLSTIT